MERDRKGGGKVEKAWPDCCVCVDREKNAIAMCVGTGAIPPFLIGILGFNYERRRRQEGGRERARGTEGVVLFAGSFWVFFLETKTEIERD